MGKSNRQAGEVARFHRDIRSLLRMRVREAIEITLEEELAEEHYTILILDGFHLTVRLARRVVSVPVLAVLGVADDGTKVLVALRLAPSEASEHWNWLIEVLKARGQGAALHPAQVGESEEALPGARTRRAAA